MTTFYLKNLLNDESFFSDDKIDLSKFSLSEPVVTIDCSETENVELSFAIPVWHTLYLINCNHKIIYFGKEVPQCVNIYIEGQYNGIFCQSGDINISGGNNSITVSYDGCANVCASNNKISCWNNSHTVISGNDNTIMLWHTASARIPTEAKNNQIYLLGRSCVNNKSQNTSIIAKDYSSVYSVVEPVIMLDQAMFYKIYIGSVGKQICKEPLEDGKRGYFYKVVRKDMTPFYKNDAPEYKVGEYYYPDVFDDSTAICSNGIHFFPDIAHAVDLATCFADREYVVLKLIVEFDDFAPIKNPSTNNKYRARKVFVDSIVPEEEYIELHKILSQKI